MTLGCPHCKNKMYLNCKAYVDTYKTMLKGDIIIFNYLCPECNIKITSPYELEDDKED